jgi:general secretion pathway protein J
MARRTTQHGFTLVELLVALFALALLAVMSWRGLDGMARAQAQTEARADEALTLQVGLAQWGADLDALAQQPQVPAIEWNGRVLRMTRRSTAAPTDGLLVVGWARRVVAGRGMWLRWQSLPVFTRGEHETAWQQADIWAANPGEAQTSREVAVVPLDEWQIFFFREDAWTNPLSSDIRGGPPPATPPVAGQTVPVVPDGVRLVLSLPPGTSINGTLTRDWVRPTLGGGR